MPHACNEDQVVERPATGLFVELDWTAVPRTDQPQSVTSTLRQASCHRGIPRLKQQVSLLQTRSELEEARRQSELLSLSSLAGLIPPLRLQLEASLPQIEMRLAGAGIGIGS
jgi:hypothetical protein